MFAGCAKWGVAANSGPEVGAIYDAIQAVAQQSQVDHRLILAIIMTESSGCVRGMLTATLVLSVKILRLTVSKLQHPMAPTKTLV